MAKEKTKGGDHKETYVAIRHVSGIQLVKCKKCGATL